MRGHARLGESPVSELRQAGLVPRERTSTVEKFYHAVREIASGKSMAKASEDVGISPSTIRRLDKERDVLFKEYEPGRTTGRPKFARWGVQRSANFPILEASGEYHEVVDLDAKNASIVGAYWHAVRVARDEQSAANVRALVRFRDARVYDIRGQTYSLETDLNRLYEFFNAWSDREREDFDRLFGSERLAVPHGR